MIGWLPLVQAASAADCSTPLTEERVRRLVERSEDGLSRDDALAHRQAYDELLAGVECLDHPIRRDLWARLLLAEAIVRKATGRDWTRPLDTAFRADPGLVVPPFLAERFEPLANPPTSEIPVPEDAALFVDGVLVTRVPVLLGDHVVQLFRDGALASRAVIDAGTVPGEWLVAEAPLVVEVERPATFTPHSYGTIGLGLGGEVGRQLVQEPGDWLTEQEQYGGLLVLSSAGVARIAGSAGVFWEGRAPLVVASARRGAADVFVLEPPAVWPELWLGAAALLDGVTLGLGGGVSTLVHYEGETRVTLVYPQPHVLLGVVGERDDLSVGAGLTPSVMHASLGFGHLVTEPRPVSVRLGADTDLDVGWLVEEAPGDRRGTAIAWSLLGRLDVAWGRDR